MKDGMITLDSQFAKEIGFTSNLFDGYLWRKGNRIIFSFIESKHPGSGNLSKLFRNIEDRGLSVAVPTPLRKMESILKHKGFVPHAILDEIMGPVELWTKSGEK